MWKWSWAIGNEQDTDFVATKLRHNHSHPYPMKWWSYFTATVARRGAFKRNIALMEQIQPAADPPPRPDPHPARRTLHLLRRPTPSPQLQPEVTRRVDAAAGLDGRRAMARVEVVERCNARATAACNQKTATIEKRRNATSAFARTAVNPFPGSVQHRVSWASCIRAVVLACSTRKMNAKALEQPFKTLFKDGFRMPWESKLLHCAVKPSCNILLSQNRFIAKIFLKNHN